MIPRPRGASPGSWSCPTARCWSTRPRSIPRRRSTGHRGRAVRRPAGVPRRGRGRWTRSRSSSPARSRWGWRCTPWGCRPTVPSRWPSKAVHARVREVLAAIGPARRRRRRCCSSTSRAHRPPSSRGSPSGSTTRSTWCRRALAAGPGAGGLAGLHCCGRADWPVVLYAGPQILSLPVDAGRPSTRGGRRLPRPGRLGGLGRGADRPAARRDGRDPLAPHGGRVGRPGGRRVRSA